ncbi:MAG: methionyl-tRNA formyltransferase [Candidatus Nitrosotenuis sp.]
MNLILFAHQNWGVEAIKEIHRSEHKILRVYTHPMDMDKHEKQWYHSVKQECEKLAINVEERKNILDQDIQTIKKLKPDLIFSIGWRRLIPQSIFEIPSKGTLNIHDGLLPAYRGFAPINWAIINGETEVGVTVHLIDKTADTGPILFQEKIPVNLDETATDVYNKALKLAPSMVMRAISLMSSMTEKLIDQTNLEKGFFCSRRFPNDGKINWTLDRIKVYNLIRGLSDPYPNAFCYYNNNKIYIKKAKLSDEDYRGPPGRICLLNENGMIVTCGTNTTNNQAILITEIANDEKSYKPIEFFNKLWEDLS